MRRKGCAGGAAVIEAREREPGGGRNRERARALARGERARARDRRDDRKRGVASPQLVGDAPAPPAAARPRGDRRLPLVLLVGVREQVVGAQREIARLVGGRVQRAHVGEERELLLGEERRELGEL